VYFDSIFVTKKSFHTYTEKHTSFISQRG